MITTTYRQDYIAPASNRYAAIDKHAKKTSEQQCDCDAKLTVQGPTSAAECDKAEWTGVAPMGRLINPRIIPTKLQYSDPEGATKAEACAKDEPNRFLKVLRTCYPDLYERLKNISGDELNRQLDVERLRTTYQIDFCHLNEYPEGLIYNTWEEKKHDETLKMTDGCDEFRDGIMAELERQKVVLADDCQSAYKPVKFNFSDSSRFTNTNNSSHWGMPSFGKKPVYTEYMDSVSKTGCIIRANSIHSHSKCQNGKNCRHKIRMNVCNKMK